MTTNNDTLKTNNRTITTLLILIAILIAPLLFIWLKGAWKDHNHYITENEIADYVTNYLYEEPAVCLGQTTVDDQIVTWWRIGEPLGKIRVLNFKKAGDKYYYLERDRSPTKESFGYSQTFSDGFAVLITAENCVKFSYVLNETMYTVPVDAVPFAFCFPQIPQDLIPYIDG